MIYLDNSATTFPKPDSVSAEVYKAMKYYCANPGRSGHKLSLLAASKVFECRSAVCKLFNIDDENKVIFTSGCTASLNMVIKGVLESGDHCVISSLEHNSVLRPLQKLKSKNITYSVAQVYPEDDEKTLNSFRNCINEKTKLFVCTHASNVFGIRLPIERLCALAHSYGVMFCVDAAQSAGVLDVNVGEYGYDFVCCAGHKGLYGPMGTGVLVVNSDYNLSTLIEGGTGSESSNFNQPDFYPDKFESGTLNVAGICGLKKGIDFVISKNHDKIHRYEINLLKKLYISLSKNRKIILHTSLPSVEYFAPVLSFSVRDTDSEKVASFMNNNYSICVRAGLHCAPLAHKYMNTEKYGTIRISPSVFTTEKHIDALIHAVNNFNFYKELS
ncbi:MAG: aminotransferase class V-fold PLP-dependent enzyme [Ruminococcus sp.]|nr:aminotransferase class V-fold PLP-dependent enzyme [Ruminococcus sp.]